MEFKNPTLAAKFNLPLGDHDIMIPGQHKGLLSDVHDEVVIKGMIERNSNLVQPKAEKPATPAAQTK